MLSHANPAYGVACPACKAAPEAPCVAPDTSPGVRAASKRRGLLRVVSLPQPHASRVARAQKEGPNP